MDRLSFCRILRGLLLIGGAACFDGGGAWAQVPNAPPAPACGWDASSGQNRSTCRFKPDLVGNPTSVVGNRVILFTRSARQGHGDSRTYSANALKRLSAHYGFTATITEDPAIFTPANLANTKVVIMSNGDGDVLPSGSNRTALENFQQVNGWGVIWLHAACAFITSAWPFGQNSCVQQYHHHNPAGTPRRIFLDSGTTASPNHGLRNPQSEFLMRSVPGWAGRTFAMSDEFYCFRSSARSTAGVNVLLGYDRSSGLPDPGCPEPTSRTVAASQNHNLAWTRTMGQGITIYNSIGHDDGTYTSGGNMGDSLLWRFIRYAAKDWEGAPTPIFKADAKPLLDQAASSGPLSLTFADAGNHAVTVSDASGQRVFARTYAGVHRAEIPSLGRGIYFVRVASRQKTEVKTVRLI